MLTFQQKAEICSTFPQLQRKEVSLGRLNYSFEESAYEKKTVVYHLHPNGNGYVYAGLLTDVESDAKGFVNIRDLPAQELRELIRRSIESLSGSAIDAEEKVSLALSGQSGDRMWWTGPDHQRLSVFFEDELWYIYSGPNLESAFETYEEAEEYLREEGFARE